MLKINNIHIQKKNILSILLYFGIFLLGLITLIYIPSYVPSHHADRAILFGILAVLGGGLLFYKFIANYTQFILISIVILPVIPYFEGFLIPIGGNLFRILPQVYIISLAILGILLHRIPAKNTFINKFILMWLLFNAVALPASINIPNSIPLFIAGVIGPCVFLFIVHNRIINNSNDFRKILIAFILSASLYLSFSMLLIFTTSPSLSLKALYLGRFGSELALGPYSSNALPGYTAFVLPLLFWLVVTRYDLGRKVNWAVRILFFLIIFMIITLLSKGGILLLILYLMSFMLYFLITKGKLRAFFSIRNILFISILVGLIFYFFTIPQYNKIVIGRFFDQEHISGFKQLANVAMQNQRIIIWTNALYIFRDNWLTGVGLGNIRHEMKRYSGWDYDSHNLPLDILAEQGIFCFVAFVIAIGVLTIKVIKSHGIRGKTKREMNIALYLGVLAFIFYGSTTGSRLISFGETIAGLGSYFLFISMALQYYLTRQGEPVIKDDINKSEGTSTIIESR